MLAEKIHKIILKNKKEEDIYTPFFFRLSNPEQKAELSALLESKTYIKASDTIESQMRELVKSRKPALTLTPEEIDTDVKALLGGLSLEEYGVWVYYPWSERLVHIPDEKEFVELRTNRNKYKITDAEEVALSKKVIGVVGLSVGQSVSLTMAIERIFGELRIADFDDLEITNLNRLRSGISNMGLKKTVIVAREIAEIDPFLKVTPFSEGLTHENINDFFTTGGKLDLIIDECDGLDMKIILRHKAKSLQIPVVMEASDRGTIDIERFDLEPDRSLLHGFIDHLDHTIIGSLTNEEKIPYILPMLGAETISARLKASMVEVKQSINTWPQLASAVALGGALCADVCRRILLDQYHGSGRFFVDIEDFIGDKPKKMEGIYDAVEMSYPELEVGEMNRIVSALSIKKQEGRAVMSDAVVQQLVAAGIAAPSAGNNQPWKWLSKDNVLYLFHDKRQSFSWTDKENFISQIALGAAAENVVIKAASLGYDAHFDLFPSGTNESLIAAIQFQKVDKAAADASLEKYIGRRCTNRKKGTSASVDTAILDEIKNAASSVPGSAVSFLTNAADIARFADIESSAERVRFMHPQSHSEFFSKELRWNDSGKEIITEGLDIKTLEMSLSDETGLRVASSPEVIALLNQWKGGKVFEKAARNAILSSAAIGMVSIPHYAPENFVNGGRVAEHAWLLATKNNIAIHPVSAPLFLYYNIKYGDKKGVSENMINEIDALYRKLCILFPELEKRSGVFLFRVSNADAPTARSLRKPIDEVFNVI